MTAFAVRTFLTLFVVLDPVGLGPIFLGLSANRSREERRAIARRSVFVASGVLLVFALAGSWTLHSLHVSIEAFRVAGGLLLFKIAFDMVFAQLERETREEAAEARARQDISVFPLAVPLIAGPGALASIMILAGEGREYPNGTLLVLGLCLLVLALVYSCLRLASRIADALGQTGINVVTRVLGILLAALAVQYVADGLKGLLAAGS
ncbi:MAG: MarC family protein [Vicinamibacteria bacterium]|nr:MarC family protein [Vicinamibacteria bacterium]